MPEDKAIIASVLSYIWISMPMFSPRALLSISLNTGSDADDFGTITVIAVSASDPGLFVLFSAPHADKTQKLRHMAITIRGILFVASSCCK